VSDAVSLGVLKTPLTAGQLAADTDTQFDQAAMAAG